MTSIVLRAHTHIGVASLHGMRNQNFQDQQNNLSLLLVSASKLAIWALMSICPQHLNCALHHNTVNRCSELQSQHAVRCRYRDGQNRRNRFADMHQPVHHQAGLRLLCHTWTDLHSSKQLLPPNAKVTGVQWSILANAHIRYKAVRLSQSGQHVRFGHRLQVCGQFR